MARVQGRVAGPCTVQGRVLGLRVRLRPVYTAVYTSRKHDRVGLSRYRCRLVFGLLCAQGSMYYVGVHTSATWRMPFNRPCAEAMRPVVKLL